VEANGPAILGDMSVTPDGTVYFTDCRGWSAKVLIVMPLPPRNFRNCVESFHFPLTL
jgi:hypothetical protein